jgi:hypothetical protein
MKKTRATKQVRAMQSEEIERPEGKLRAELVRVRARFGVDEAASIGTLPEPWTSPSGAVEEDEAEFADALADCLSVGLPLNAAVASWISGELARDQEEEEPADGGFLSGPARAAASADVRAPTRLRLVLR